MRKGGLTFAASMVVTVLGANFAAADSLDFITSGQNHPGNYFSSNDTVYWSNLGVNAAVPNGATTWSQSGVATTITFGFGTPGRTAVQDPALDGSWFGNLAPGQVLLLSHDIHTGASSGTLSLGFGQGVSGAGFQIQTDELYLFHVQIGVYDGSTLLATFFGTGYSLSNEDNSAAFFGVEDLTGANITLIKIAAYGCEDGADPVCYGGFAINHLRLQDGPNSTTPEPASWTLLGSSLAILGYLRRLAIRKI